MSTFKTVVLLVGTPVHRLIRAVIPMVVAASSSISDLQHGTNSNKK